MRDKNKNSAARDAGQNELLGKLVWSEDGAQITAKKITGVWQTHDDLWIAFADMPDGIGGTHVGPCNTLGALRCLVMSMRKKPSLSQSAPIFCGFAKGAYSAQDTPK